MATETRRGPAPPLRSILVAGGFLLAVAVAAVVGGLAAAGAGDAYQQLDRPVWAPPSWLFTPVWTVLYLLIAAAGWLVWRASGFRGARGFFVVYAVQLVLNAGWTPLFFGLGWYGAAFAEICLLAASIAALIALGARHDRIAAALFVPYLVWTGYAGALNLAIWVYN